MSFFGKLKGSSSTPSGAHASSGAAGKKADPNAPVPTPLEKHLVDATGPVRPDGSDKFFGFENYGSTCYCNSIIQCLYYSAPFRDHVLNFPSQDFLQHLADAIATNGGEPNGKPVLPRNTSTTPYPNPLSPARKPMAPQSPGPGTKPEDTKDSPEHRKKLALAAGPVLGMTGDNSTKYGMDESLFTSLKDIFEAIIGQQSRVGVVSPHKFLEILRRENEMFRSAMHQDAHEFLNLLLNQVVDNVEMFSKQHPQLPGNGAAPENGPAAAMSSAVVGANQMANGMDTHWVHDLFEGLLTSETRCLTCENTSQRDEAFLDLSVDLAAHTSVTSCLRKFSEEEMLCERNKFHCDNCGGLQEAEKRMKIKRLPRILALHLKRFKYTEDLQRLQKLFHKVQYPFHLRLFNTTDDAEDPDRLYELYAVVVHIGGGPYHGHYVSIIKTQDRGWLLFDDELVEPVDKSYVLNFFGGEPQPGVQDAKQLACAYVLFYQETTLEAMLREQELENQPPSHQPAAQRASNDHQQQQNTSPIVPSTTSPLQPTQPTPKPDLRQTLTTTSPPLQEMDHMDPLAHARTAPMSPSVFVPVMPAKSKKEIKAEQKAKKAREKEEAKELDEKRKAQSTKRMEAWKRQEEEYRRVVEESRAMAAEEAKGDKGAEKEKLGSVPQGEAAPMSERMATTQSDVGDGGGKNEALGRSATTTTDKVKNRFSLGRKKSQALQ